jgi:Flp pilus assembly CpaF family ATPase
LNTGHAGTLSTIHASSAKQGLVSKERYIKAFDPAVLAAMKSMEASLDMLNDCSATVQQVN